MLKYQRTKIMSSDFCLTSTEKTTSSDQFICTQATAEDTFPVLDNGSALISSDGKEVIGIATWRRNDLPNAFGRIRTYLPWIKLIIFE